MGVNEADRVVVNKIYVGRATLFGLLYGLLMGIVVGVFAVASILFGDYSIEIPGFVGAGALMIFIGVIVFYTISGVIMFFASSLVYNIIALTSVKMHFNFGKYMIASSAGKVAVNKGKGVKPVVIKGASSAGVQAK